MRQKQIVRLSTDRDTLVKQLLTVRSSNLGSERVCGV